jgi:hypothetical protein
MSTALAIAATTAVLKHFLDEAMGKAQLALLGTITVSAVPPDHITTGTNETSQLNLFMYHATPNIGWRNAHEPSRDGRGERSANPPLALDLHYLLSAYGAEDFHAEMLLGVGMQLMHQLTVLTRDAIRAAFTPPQGGALSAAMQVLATTELAEQIELIKICPQTLSIDELSKLWSATQECYRPTAAYSASVVLIESRSSFKSALPVRERKLYAMPLRQPVIASVEPQMIALTPGAALKLHGQELLAPNTVVRFGTGGEQAPTANASTDTQLLVPLLTTLLAGVNTVQVVQQLLIGPPTLHEGFVSNVAAFVLRPSIAKKTVNNEAVYDITPSTTPAIGTAPRSGTITIKFNPVVGKQQRVELLLNELNPPTDRAARAYTFTAPSRDQPATDATTDTLAIPIFGVQQGDYLVRVRVDGAESSLDINANNRYITPGVKIA